MNEYKLTDAEMFEALGIYSEHHCSDCLWRGDGEEIADDTYCWTHEMTIRPEWYCGCWQEDET